MSGDDTSGLVGGPIKRNGAKGRVAHLLVPYFAPAKVYAEAFFGAGSVFYRIPPGTYEREAVNDLDASLVTFFRVLRDPDDPRQSYFESVEELREGVEAAQREALMRELRLWRVERYPELALDDLPEGQREGEGLLAWVREAKTAGAFATWWGSFDPDTQYAIALGLADAPPTATPPNS